MVDCGTVVLCSQERSYWFAIEALFALFFFVEAILRIHQLGYDYFLDAWLTPQKKSRFSAVDRNKVEPQPFVSICGVGNCGFGTIHWFRLFPVRKVASTKDSWNVYDYTLVVLSGADIVAP